MSRFEFEQRLFIAMVANGGQSNIRSFNDAKDCAQMFYDEQAKLEKEQSDKSPYKPKPSPVKRG